MTTHRQLQGLAGPSEALTQGTQRHCWLYSHTCVRAQGCPMLDLACLMCNQYTAVEHELLCEGMQGKQ